jgi:hypothetical protein
MSITAIGRGYQCYLHQPHSCHDKPSVTSTLPASVECGSCAIAIDYSTS